jgi:steroid delta-isomerase-like uncharacterized protein
MSAENNKATAQRWYEEVFNGGNLSVIDELFSPNFRDYDPVNPAPGLEGVRQVVGMYRGAFPDLHITIEDWVAEGDKVVARFTARGTNKGPLMGMPSTGKQATVAGIDILGFENGKIVAHWGNRDELGMLQQLGLAPAPGQAR